PLGPGTLAAGLAFVDYGEVEELVPDGLGLVGVPTGGVVTGGEVALSLGYGLRAGPVVLGAVARSLRVELAGLDATATALDV
ncbi:MAG: hypothetical protein GWN71_43655, partial [Gammaproteobacteria bacterium]|nr:hypothetical protein [Gemmatimonadota bacterium]NIU80189.1 hypothetical protein [Gammaproteobacteria bacterium]